MEKSKYGKMSFYELANKFENTIYDLIHQLHIKQPYDDFFQEGLFALWKVYQMYDTEKEEFSTFAKNEIENGLLQFKLKHPTRLTKDIVVSQVLLKQGIASILKPIDDPYVRKTIQSKMTVNQWKWIYQYIILNHP